MSSGRTLSYHRENVKPGVIEVALFIRDAHNGPWLLVGIYENKHVHDILRTTYANWPKDCVHLDTLP